jgi:hypothetical protein
MNTFNLIYISIKLYILKFKDMLVTQRKQMKRNDSDNWSIPEIL